MSDDELKRLVDSLSPTKRAELSEYLLAAEEGVSVEEFRRMNAAIDEALHDPSPGYTLDQVRAEVESLKLDDVP